MDYKSSEIYKKRDFNELISDTFGFFIKEAKLFLKSITIFILPFLFLKWLVRRFAGYIYVPSIKQMFVQHTTENIEFSLLFNAINFLQATMLIVVVASYLKLYTEKGQGNFKIKDISDEIRKGFFKILGSNILIAVSLLFAIAFLFLPFIYLSVIFSVIPFILVFEKISIGKAFSRSFQLFKGNWWQAFGAFVVFSVLYTIISLLFSLIFPRIFMIFGFSPFFFLISSSINGLLSALIMSPLFLLFGFFFLSYAADTKPVEKNVLDKKRVAKKQKQKKEDKSNKLYEDDEWTKLQEDEQKNRFLNNEEKDRFKPKY